MRKQRGVDAFPLTVDQPGSRRLSVFIPIDPSFANGSFASGSNDFSFPLPVPSVPLPRSVFDSMRLSTFPRRFRADSTTRTGPIASSPLAVLIDNSVQCLPCVSFNDSELLSSRMHTELARQLNTAGIWQSIWTAFMHTIHSSVVMRKRDDEFLKDVEEGNKAVSEMKEEIEMCDIVFQSLRRERLECLKQLAASLSPSPSTVPKNFPSTQTKEFLSELDHLDASSSPGPRNVASTRIAEFFLNLDQCQRLQSHLDTLIKSAEGQRIGSQMRATVKRTGYHGIIEWTERISRTHENLLQTIAQVAFVGAGLTYGSIFSSSRGNVGLMCYAFALFDCGFIIPTVSLALLKWASSRPKDTLFRSPYAWTLLLNIFTYISVAAVGSAICLLNLTLYLLVFPHGTNGQPSDASLQLNVSPTPAGGISLGCLSLAIGMVLMCALVHYTARGKNAFVHDLMGHRANDE